MRLFVQFLIPALIVLGVFLIVSRSGRRRAGPHVGPDGEQQDDPETPAGSDAATFIAILLIGAAVVLGLAVALQDVWGA